MGASGSPSRLGWDERRSASAPTGPPDWRLPVLREKSCGIVPFREVDGEILYLVISSAVTKREHWEFPKGGVEEGEREIETALRELWEETGVKDVRVLPGYREPIRYIYRRPEGLVSKQVVYFIAEVGDPRVKLREVEAKDYRWANYEESRKLLRHANARALLARCHAFITGKPLPQEKPGATPELGDAAEAEGQRRRGGRRRQGRQRGQARQQRGQRAAGARQQRGPQQRAGGQRLQQGARAEEQRQEAAPPGELAAKPGGAAARAAGAAARTEAPPPGTEVPRTPRRRKRRRRRRRGGGQQQGAPAAGTVPAKDPG